MEGTILETGQDILANAPETLQVAWLDQHEGSWALKLQNKCSGRFHIVRPSEDVQDDPNATTCSRFTFPDATVTEELRACLADMT